MDSAENRTVVSAEQFLSLSSFLYQASGIYLANNEKNYNLIYNRTLSLCRKHSISSLNDLIARLKNDRLIQSNFVESMTTNTTSFFRESNHFDFLSDFYQQKTSQFKPGEPILMWCAACSTGEEPYSLAMTALETPPMAKHGFKILATDISPKVVSHAKRGYYHIKSDSSFPKEFLSKYFIKRGIEEYQVADSLSNKVQFANLNLKFDYPFTKQFDVVFCRNVLIYFEIHDIAEIIDKMVSAMKIGGILFLGHCEVAMGKHEKLKKLGPAIFQKI